MAMGADHLGGKAEPMARRPGSLSRRRESLTGRKLMSMTRSCRATWLAAAALLGSLATSLGGEWCENFETGPGTFWVQSSFQGGLWQSTTYSNETAHGHDVPKPPTGEDGLLLLRPSQHSIVVWSMLVSQEMKFEQDASIELDYWLWFNRSQPLTPVSFMLFRRVNGIEDEEAFLNISAYANVYQSHWASIVAGVDLSRGDILQIAVYGYMAGDGPVMTSDLGLDRIILRGVNGHNECGGNSTVPTVAPSPAPSPGPTTSENTTPAEPTTASAATTPHYDFFCPEAYGLFADPDDCHYFYQCNDWLAQKMTCAADLVFNPQTDQCDYRKNVPGC